jgi:predicted amino acid-binding ACT domain protein
MAIFMDLVSFAQDRKIIWPQPVSPRRSTKVGKTENRSGRYYVRMDVENHPGVLASVSKVLGRNKININSVLQPEVDKAKAAVLIIMCGPATERSLNLALKEISALKSVRSKPVFIRVEDDLHAQQVALAATT